MWMSTKKLWRSYKRNTSKILQNLNVQKKRQVKTWRFFNEIVILAGIFSDIIFKIYNGMKNRFARDLSLLAFSQHLFGK